MKIKSLKILNSLVTTILITTFITLVFIVISTKASGGEPSIFGYQIKTVLSGSMEPTFKTGSVIAVEPIKNPSTLKKGDIITFTTQDEKIVTHRIEKVIGKDKQLQFKTKGDNNEDPDFNNVLAQNVVAKFTGFTIPYVGYLVEFSQSRNGSALLLIVPGILLVLYSIYTIWSLIREIEPSEQDKSLKSNS